MKEFLLLKMIKKHEDLLGLKLILEKKSTTLQVIGVPSFSPGLQYICNWNQVFYFILVRILSLAFHIDSSSDPVFSTHSL